MYSVLLSLRNFRVHRIDKANFQIFRNFPLKIWNIKFCITDQNESSLKALEAEFGFINIETRYLVL